ncbi:cupin domain-containing protein [Patescibacteria group bacterium]|nr:cupin domain-containing protein [Patescibacteria group bacterium]
MKYISAGGGREVVKKDYKKRIIFELEDFKEPGHLLQIVNNFAKTKQSYHHHKKQTEVWYILEGDAIWRINGVEYRVKPGDAFIINPGDKHQADNQSNKDMKVLVLKINFPKDDEDFYLDE